MFSFKGGVRCETPEHTEKFLLFLVDGKEEVDFFTSLNIGLLYPAIDTEGNKITNTYESRLNLLKIFCFQTRYRAPNQKHSFYFMLSNESNFNYEINGFGLGADGFQFKATGKLLSRDEALIQVKNTISREFLRNQGPLPRILQSKMVFRRTLADLQEVKTRVIRRTK